MSRAKELALKLNRPMLKRLIHAAENIEPNWGGAATVYPPGAQQLIGLINAVLNGDESEDLAMDHEQRMTIVKEVISRFVPEMVQEQGIARAAITEQATIIVDRWEQDIHNTAVRVKIGVDQ